MHMAQAIKGEGLTSKWANSRWKGALSSDRRESSPGTRVTSVCSGALLLARAGLLEGKRATTHWGALGLLESLGGVTVDRVARVVG